MSLDLLLHLLLDIILLLLLETLKLLLKLTSLLLKLMFKLSNLLLELINLLLLRTGFTLVIENFQDHITGRAQGNFEPRIFQMAPVIVPVSSEFVELESPLLLALFRVFAPGIFYTKRQTADVARYCPWECQHRVPVVII